MEPYEYNDETKQALDNGLAKTDNGQAFDTIDELIADAKKHCETNDEISQY